jgi:diadenosine tetraphosphatase ApaH/serine/threonine PP2A family protein phosphatase
MQVLIISDIHANLVALETVLKAAGEFDTVWNLGDVVGYGPRPRECVERVIGLEPSASLIGNHDWAAIGRLALDEFNPVARYATYWTTAHLRAEHMTYLEGLPNRIIEDDWMLVHGSPRHPIWEYVYTARVASQNFSLFDAPVCFLGHTHIQLFITDDMARRGVAPVHPLNGDTLDIVDHRFIVNPGSVGQPRDNDPTAAFALYDTETRRVTFRRVPYDVSETQAQMEAAGLPQPLITRLALGV